MTRDERRGVELAMVARIVDTIRNPAEWLLSVRIIGESAGLDMARCLPIGGVTLEGACFAVVDFAHKQGASLGTMLAAIDSPLSCPALAGRCSVERRIVIEPAVLPEPWARQMHGR